MDIKNLDYRYPEEAIGVAAVNLGLNQRSLPEPRTVTGTERRVLDDVDNEYSCAVFPDACHAFGRQFPSSSLH